MTFRVRFAASRSDSAPPGWPQVVRVLPVLAALVIWGCGGTGSSGDPEQLSVDTGPTNVNITDPTLRVANNTPATLGATLDLVWSDEFNAAQLDPQT